MGVSRQKYKGKKKGCIGVCTLLDKARSAVRASFEEMDHENKVYIKKKSFTAMAMRMAELIASHHKSFSWKRRVFSLWSLTFFSSFTIRCSMVESCSRLLSNFLMFLSWAESRLKWRNTSNINGIKVGIKRLNLLAMLLLLIRICIPR